MGAQITGYSHRQLLFDGGGGVMNDIVHGQSGGGGGRGKVPPHQMEVAVAAVDQAATAQQQGAPQMTTFKPIAEDRLRHNQVCSSSPWSGRILTRKCVRLECCVTTLELEAATITDWKLTFVLRPRTRSRPSPTTIRIPPRP